jgi:hypothetical protein
MAQGTSKPAGKPTKTVSEGRTDPLWWQYALAYWFR